MRGDIADVAQALEELDRERALKQRRNEGPPAIGVCYYCSEPVGEGLRFCDADCRDDWETEKRQKILRRG